MNITLATHYCGDKAVSTSVVFDSDTIGCGMESMDEECESTPSPAIQKKGCCKNEYTQLNTQNSLDIPSVSTQLENHSFVYTFINVYLGLNAANANVKADYSSYSPPSFSVDIPILIQSFRI
jgi:hypothetical protein